MILTDLSSLNGTWVNRAQLRAYADKQINAQDVIAFGSSDATFQLIAIDAPSSALPSALDSADAILGIAWNETKLDESVSDEPGSDAQELSDSNIGLLHQRDNLAAQYRATSSRADKCKSLLQVKGFAKFTPCGYLTRCTASVVVPNKEITIQDVRHKICMTDAICLVQLANVERRLAKRGLQGNFACARIFYRAATEELGACIAESSSSNTEHTSQHASAQAAGTAAQEHVQHSSHVDMPAQQHPATPAADAESRAALEQKQAEAPAGDTESLAVIHAAPSPQSDLVRGLQSWARMEGYLG